MRLKDKVPHVRETKTVITSDAYDVPKPKHRT